MSTNLTEQISRRFQKEFREKSRRHLHCFGLLCIVMYRIYFYDVVWLNIEQKHDMHFIQHGGRTKTKLERSVSTEISDLVPSFITVHQCGRSSYTKISRRTSKFQEISRISRSCRHPDTVYCNNVEFRHKILHFLAPILMPDIKI